MLKASGVVEAVARNGKAFLLDSDPDIWYSVARGDSVSADLKGSEVSFEYKENPKGDTVFYNVQGKLEIEPVAASKPAARSPATAARGRPVSGAGTSSSSPDPRQQSIVRQNSLTQANMLMRTIIGDAGVDDPEGTQLARDIVELARIFEAYSMGEN